ncbi:hypothetical protein BGX30_014359 [Mortierella sp. GBA39]|nr:hypothetical protein BGX30_014359 [Mortierella sp. GBA39]
MASSILQLSPHQHQHQPDNSSPPNHIQLHPEDPSDSTTNNKVAYDLRRLKVYSSCLRCRTKKVKCDRKEPCSRCQKHNVECSYRELTSVQLDIRQFQRHLNSPKIRKDGAGIITSTATPVIASSHASPSNSLSPVPVAASSSTITFSSAHTPPIIHYNIHNNNNNNSNNCPVDYTADAIPPSSSLPSPSKSNSNSNSPSVRKGMMMTKSESSSVNSCIDAESCANLLLAVSAKNINNKTAAATTGPTAIDRVRIHKIHRRKLSSKPTKPVPDCIYGNSSMCMELSDINDHVDKVQLSESSPSRPSPPIATSNPASVSVSVAAPAYKRFSSDSDDIEDNNANVPIWRAQAVGKHTQTVHEQDMAETFGLAAYLKAKEMEISQDPGRAGQTIDYEKELERALAQRMPSSFSRPDRSRSRAEKNGQPAYNQATPYARPSYCQLSPSPSSSASARAGSPSSNNATPYTQQQPPPTAQCCCQIAAMQGQALGSCPYSNVSHGGYENSHSKPMLASPPPSTRSATVEHDESARIAYSPSYSPSYVSRDTASVSESTTSSSLSSSFTLPQLKISSNWPPSSGTKLPSMLTSPTSPSSPSMRMDLSSPRTELAPIRLPVSAPVTVSASSQFEVGRDDTEPVQIDCKYNEPNVDAWDMIEKPISRTVPLTTKRGRSIKMEMGWILS